MAKKQTDDSPLSLLDAVSSNISGTIGESSSLSNLDDATVRDEDDDNVIDLSKTKANKEVDDDASLDDVNVDLTEDDISLNDDTAIKTTNTESTKTTSTSDTDEEQTEQIDTEESTQVEMFFDAFAEQLGWEADENEEKPKTIEEFIGYIQDLVDEESKPQYSNTIVEELDTYIKNGGKFEDFYDIQKSLTNLDDLDLTDESNQKSVVTEYLKMTGNTEAQIQKKIRRWEDAGTLEDEAEDNLEALKELKERQKTETMQEQERIRQEQEEAYKQFHSNVVKSIDEMVDVRGIKIPVEDRKRLKDYAFKVESDGTTKFQKDYAKNLSKNFIESAYFTMKGDALITTAKKAGESSAIEKLRASLKTKPTNKSKHAIDNTSANPIWSAASNVLMGGR